jgi:hypothetical protein
MVGVTQKRKKVSNSITSRKLTRSVKLLRARLKKYEQCRDAKCTPELIMDKELKKYSKLVKNKCGRLPKNLNTISDKEMRAHTKCTSKLYGVSRYHRLWKKQFECVKKNCNYMQIFYPGQKTIQ